MECYVKEMDSYKVKYSAGGIRTLEGHPGEIGNIISPYLERHKKGEGVIPSAAHMRALISGNPNLESIFWYTSTLIATNKNFVKVISPYLDNRGTLTEAAKFSLDIIASNKNRSNLDYSDWERIDGEGVCTHPIEEWVKKGFNEAFNSGEEMFEQYLRNISDKIELSSITVIRSPSRSISNRDFPVPREGNLPFLRFPNYHDNCK